MGWIQRVYLNSSQIYVCKNCKTHLSTEENVISRDFNGKHGEAYLVCHVFNLDEGKVEEREMRTGKHAVRDVYCTRCRSYVGWRYCHAFLSTESYKEGKFILEATCLTKERHEQDV